MEGIDRVDGLLLGVLGGLTDRKVTARSRLPGWTRGHVLAHIAGVGNAVARQVENAVADREPVDYYDGGRAGRDAAIEAAAADTAAEHVERVRATIDRVSAALSGLTPELMDRPTGHRNLPVRDLVITWWREAGVHVTDLDLGVDHTVWDAAFREHLAEYLTARVPQDLQLELLPTDVDERWTLGAGDLMTARGAGNDLFAWLAGRKPLAPVVFDRSGVSVPPPELGPWP